MHTTARVFADDLDDHHRLVSDLELHQPPTTRV
jgi:hypothetical protein